MADFMKIARSFARHCGWIPDSIYLKGLYYLKMKRPLDLKNPKGYNEKLQWMKINYHRPDYPSMVDKIEAKKIAAGIIGEEYIIPTLGVWGSFDEIDFSKLPEKFVLKNSNGAGGTGVVICRNKSELDINAARQSIATGFDENIYKTFREWVYKDIPKRILAEELLDTEDGSAPVDYKFYCFDGEPKVMAVASGRFQGKTCFDYYDMNLNHLPFCQGGPNSDRIIEKPRNFDLMVELAKKLSQGHPHVRIDLYDFKGKVYFGEFTFCDSSGFAKFSPEEWNLKFGEWFKLPSPIK